MRLTWSQRLIRWLFALGAFILAWQVTIVARVESLAGSLGLQKGSTPYELLINGGIPIVLSLIALGAEVLFERFWRWFQKFGGRSGWWMYGLVTNEEGRRTEITGIFRILQTNTQIRIREGRAWYFDGKGEAEKDKFSYRGDWYSDFVWIEEDQIRLFFIMNVKNPPPWDIPSMYQGAMFLSRRTGNRLLGTESWEGTFNDLEERRNIDGWVYTERLRRLSTRKPDRAEQIMRNHAGELVKRVRVRAR